MARKDRKRKSTARKENGASKPKKKVDDKSGEHLDMLIQTQNKEFYELYDNIRNSSIAEDLQRQLLNYNDQAIPYNKEHVRSILETFPEFYLNNNIFTIGFISFNGCCIFWSDSTM